jgi:aspartyl-tRNA(Asn)/glutamyl-tRNA(Gln) amidotransferase subunit B
MTRTVKLKIYRYTAKGLFPRLRGTETVPGELVRAEGLGQVCDVGALEAAVADVIARHPAQVAEFRSGKDRVVGFLVGQVMKATKGKGNPQLVQEVLRKALG